MRQQLQLPLDHTPSFQAGAELVLLRSTRRPRLEGRVFDDERSIPVVFRASRDLMVSTIFLSCFNRVSGVGAHPSEWDSVRHRPRVRSRAFTGPCY